MPHPTLPERITLRRVKGWRLPEGARVVTRATIFGNPFTFGDPGRWNMPRVSAVGWDVSLLEDFPVDQAAAVDRFGTWLRGGILPIMPAALTDQGRLALRVAMQHRRDLILGRLPELRGRPLACTCKPGERCHADVLIELANRGEA